MGTAAMKARFIWFGAGGLALLAGLYAAYPYVTLQLLERALRESDRVALETLVDWTAVRQGMEEDLNILLTDAMLSTSSSGEPAETLAKGFAALLGPALVDRAVDAYVTPAGLVRLLSKGGRVNMLAVDDDQSGSPAQAGERTQTL